MSFEKANPRWLPILYHPCLIMLQINVQPIKTPSSSCGQYSALPEGKNKCGSSSKRKK